jgi:hypothetical protein
MSSIDSNFSLNNFISLRTGSLLSIINSDHKLIHDGYGLAFTDYRTLTNAQVFSYSFKAPSTRFVHLKNILLQSLGANILLKLPFIETDLLD